MLQLIKPNKNLPKRTPLFLLIKTIPLFYYLLTQVIYSLTYREQKTIDVAYPIQVLFK